MANNIVDKFGTKLNVVWTVDGNSLNDRTLFTVDFGIVVRKRMRVYSVVPSKIRGLTRGLSSGVG